MTTHLVPDADILVNIYKIDSFLTTLGIVPVLEYRKIRYNLKMFNEPLMFIELFGEGVRYEKSYNDDQECTYNKVFVSVEKFILAL